MSINFLYACTITHSVIRLQQNILWNSIAYYVHYIGDNDSHTWSPLNVNCIIIKTLSNWLIPVTVMLHPRNHRTLQALGVSQHSISLHCYLSMLSSNLFAGSTNPPPINPSERDNTVAITEVPAATPVASSNPHQVTIGTYVCNVVLY